MIYFVLTSKIIENKLKAHFTIMLQNLQMSNLSNEVCVQMYFLFKAL
jgi:hypothetical protein